MNMNMNMHQGGNVSTGVGVGGNVNVNTGTGGYDVQQSGAAGPYTKGPRSGSGRGEGRNKNAGGRGSGRGGGIQVGEHTGYLRMRGLPFTTTKEDIFSFFLEYDPVEGSSCLTYRSDGRATGEGYIAFSTPENARDAMELHRSVMGSRYIELFISNKEEHGRALVRDPSIIAS